MSDILTTQNIRAILTRMRELDEKDKSGQSLTHEERIYWKNHQSLICDYYRTQWNYWNFNRLVH